MLSNIVNMWNYGLPDDVAPVMTETKKKLFNQRYSTTCLGGLRLNSGQPKLFYILQLGLFLFPACIGILLQRFLLESDAPKSSHVNGSFVFAGTLFFFGLCIHVLVYCQNPVYDHTNMIHAMEDGEMDKLMDLSQIMQFLFPRKSMILTAVHLSVGAISGGLFFSCVSRFAFSSPTLAILSAFFAWMLFATSFYALIAQSPEELNIWDTTFSSPVTDTIQRSMYVVVLCGGYIVTSELNQDYIWMPSLALVLFYPLWCIGFVPKLQVLLQYLVEEGLVFFSAYGGPCISTLALMKHILCTIMIGTLLSTTAVYYPGTTFSLALLFSYVISRGYLDRYLIYSVRSKIINDSSAKVRDELSKSTQIKEAQQERDDVIEQTHPSVQQLLRQSNYSMSIFRAQNNRTLKMDFIMIAIISFLPVVLEVLYPHVNTKDVIWVILAILVLITSLMEGSKPLICFNRRNCLFLKVRAVFNLLHGPLLWILRILQVLVLYPVADQVNASSLHAQDSIDRITPGIFFSQLILFRQYHVLWTNPLQSSIEIFIYNTWLKNDIAESPGAILYLTCSAFLVSRMADFYDKAWTIGIAFYSLLIDSKLRFRGWLLASVCGFPISCFSLIVSVLFSSPLVPVGGTTIYFPGFPRPKRFWFNTAASVTSYQDHCTDDGVYYQQLLPHVIEALRDQIQKWNIRPTIRNSDPPLIICRGEKLVMIIRIYHLGLGQFTCRLKGLELQAPTSCHHKETGQLDAMFQLAFDAAADHTMANYNRYCPLNALAPVNNQLTVKDYSVSEISLLGILNHPSCLALIRRSFWYTLTYGLCNNPKALEDTTDVQSEQHHLEELYLNQFPKDWYEHLMRKKPSRATARTSENVSGGKDEHDSIREATVIDFLNHDSNLDDDEGRTFSSNRASDFDPILPHLNTTRPNPKNPRVIMKPRHTEEHDALEKKVERNIASSLWDDFADFEELLLDEQLTPLSSPPLVSTNDKSSSPAACRISSQETESPFGLDDSMAKLICACYAITQVLGLGIAMTTTGGDSHVYNCFHGKFPSSGERKWLLAHDELFKVVVQAYRLAVKMALDQFVIYGDDDHSFLSDSEQVQKSIETLIQDNYVGIRESRSWNQSILRETPHLCSLEKDSKGKYRYVVLSIQQETLQVGTLSLSSFIGQWASLSTELLYMTNDDDERYSIQANPCTYRNLSVQSSDSPLGYPVFTTGPLHIQYSM